jgi:hypothetical protein
MCPAYGTPFYMSGIPYLVELAKIYVILDKDDKMVLFDALSKVKIELMDYQKEFLASCTNPQSVEHIGEVTVPLGREKVQELGRPTLSPEAWEDIQNCCLGSQDDEEYLKIVEEVYPYHKYFKFTDEQLKLKLSSGDVVEPAMLYGEQIIWNLKPEKG